VKQIKSGTLDDSQSEQRMLATTTSRH